MYLTDLATFSSAFPLLTNSIMPLEGNIYIYIHQIQIMLLCLNCITISKTGYEVGTSEGGRSVCVFLVLWRRSQHPSVQYLFSVARSRCALVAGALLSRPKDCSRGLCGACVTQGVCQVVSLSSGLLAVGVLSHCVILLLFGGGGGNFYLF